MLHIDPIGQTVRLRPGLDTVALDERTRERGFVAGELLSAEILLPDGRIERASARENTALFGRLRAGDDVGAVIGLEFRLEPARSAVALPGVRLVGEAGRPG